MTQLTPEEVKQGLNNQWWRINHLYFIKNESGQKVLFKANQAQQHFKDNIHTLNIILKARQLGFSTLIDIMGFDMAFFTANKEVVIQAQDRIAAEKLFEEKIQFPYDNLPEQLKELNPRIKSNTRQMKFSNGSVIRVVTSARGGTTNFLHVSEFGKICAKTPEKARETVTGSLNTVAPGQFIFIESTAEGREGAFYDMTLRAIKAKQADKKLTTTDYKFHFYPWMDEPRYVSDPDNAIITQKKSEYFDLLEQQLNRTITLEQRAWYVIKEDEQGEDMKREFPSTPKEAFEQAIIGSYFANEMAKVRSEGRIRKVQYESRLPVYTFWDIGRDTTSIWFMQHHRITGEHRFIDYMHDAGRNLQYYVKEMYKKGYVFATHFLPHDANVTELTNVKEESRADVLKSLGLQVEVVPRVAAKLNAIQAVRDILLNCWFDEEKCMDGIKCLDHYRQEWDDKLGTFKRDKPLHDWASHGADSFQQFAMGFKEEQRIAENELVPEMVEDF